MAKGKKTGGRHAGTPNRRTTLEEVLARIDPTDGLVYWQQVHAIATGPHEDMHARLKALTLALAYKFDKPKERTELTGPAGGPVPISVIHKHVTVHP